jgi:cyclophilin family peptidyl-prolyl cis-trans isomerase
MFHRVVKGFIIQGGNSDNRETGKKRSKIGRYLLPPDGKKGHKHHRGVISMPSGEIDNPHKLASPYEFFIVVTKPGSYHLDGDYTPFGRVIQGMDVVDKINNVAVDDGDWPMQNVFILKAEVL